MALNSFRRLRPLLMLTVLAASVPVFAAGVRNPDGSHPNGSQAYLGIGMRSVTDPACASLHLKESHGAVVMLVDYDAPAWKAGLREHDVVVQMNGTPIDEAEQFKRLLHDLQPGTAIQLTVSRDGSLQTMNAVLANREELGKAAWTNHQVVPPPAQEQTSQDAPVLSHKQRSLTQSLMTSRLPFTAPYTGVVVDEVGAQLAEYFGMKGTTGLLVHSVEDDSPAAMAGIHAGDVITRVNNIAMTSRSDWNKALRDGKQRSLAVTLMREHREQVVTLVPDLKHRSALVEPSWPFSFRH